MARPFVILTLTVVLSGQLNAQAFFTNLRGTWKATSAENETNTVDSLVINNKGIVIVKDGREKALLPIDEIDERNKRARFKYDGHKVEVKLKGKHDLEFIALQPPSLKTSKDTNSTRTYHKLISKDSPGFKRLQALTKNIQGKWKVTKSEVGMENTILEFSGNTLSVYDEDGNEDFKSELIVEKKTESKKHNLNFVFYEQGTGYPMEIQLLDGNKMKLVHPEDEELKEFTDIFLEKVN